MSRPRLDDDDEEEDDEEDDEEDKTCGCSDAGVPRFR